MTPILDLTITFVVILVAMVAYIVGCRNGYDDAVEEMRRKSSKKVNGEGRPPTQAPWAFKPQDLRKKEAA